MAAVVDESPSIGSARPAASLEAEELAFRPSLAEHGSYLVLFAPVARSHTAMRVVRRRVTGRIKPGVPRAPSDIALEFVAVFTHGEIVGCSGA